MALPPFLMTSEKGSFARKTIEQRKPLIIDQILADYDYPQGIKHALHEFKSELKNGHVSLLQETCSDRETWDKETNPWLGKSWLDLPWFFAETYFYRRVLEIIKYFQPGPLMHQDPYQYMKDKEIRNALLDFESLYCKENLEPNIEIFTNMCYSALWGNRGDLSNLHVFDSDMGAQEDKIILNHTLEAFRFIKKAPVKIAYIFDNVGKELFFDIAFIDYLLQSGLAESVTCFLKNQPFFVSDVMPKDLLSAINVLCASDSDQCANLGNRFKSAMDAGLIEVKAPPFFTTSKMYRQMPEVLSSKIGAHDLTILKGDVNYRRLFGDRHWNHTTSIKEAGGYFPSSFLSLRTLKGEIVVGLSPDVLQNLQEHAESDWMINGARGMISFHQH